MRNNLKESFYDLVNELFGNFNELSDIIGDSGILTELNEQHIARGNGLFGNSRASLQPVRVRV